MMPLHPVYFKDWRETAPSICLHKTLVYEGLCYILTEGVGSNSVITLLKDLGLVLSISVSIVRVVLSFNTVLRFTFKKNISSVCE